MVHISLDKPCHISVAGVMGSGKTTAARLLADAFDFTLVEENADDNVFLPYFYDSPKQWAFHTQVAYLEARARVLRDAQKTLAARGVVEDTPMLQNYLGYAKAQHVLGTMTDNEFTLYERIFQTLTFHLKAPDLIVFLDAPLSLIQKRIKERGRSYEQKIPLSYLETLDHFLRVCLFTHTDTPVLSIPASELDILAHEESRERFVSMVERAL